MPPIAFPAGRPAGLLRIFLGTRLAVALAAICWALTSRQDVSARHAAAVALAVLVCYLPVRRWKALEVRLGRRPALLVFDTAATAGLILLAGGGSPLAYFAVGTLLAAGQLYRLAGAIAVLLVELAAYAVSLRIQPAASPAPAAVTAAQVGLAALWALAAVGGGVLRRTAARQPSASPTAPTAVPGPRPAPPDTARSRPAPVPLPEPGCPPHTRRQPVPVAGPAAWQPARFLSRTVITAPVPAPTAQAHDQAQGAGHRPPSRKAQS
ncbi:hypothetical protein [Streptomyces mirabilis]|uniref:hypothetical protein n=1 Tax=Streptomyces mirabilis TaxID=68239 RepID=UPI0037FB512C